MTFKYAFLFACSALSACVEASSQPSASPAQMKLQSACDAGDLAACETILAKEQSDQAAYRSAMRAISRPIVIDQGYQIVPPRQTQFQTGMSQSYVCPFTGQIIPLGGVCT